MQSQAFLDRILLQASAKDAKLEQGGPSKIFIVVKHLSTKSLNDLS